MIKNPRTKESIIVFFTFPDAFSKASTISRTDVPFPVPRLYTSQPKIEHTQRVTKLSLIHSRKQKQKE